MLGATFVHGLDKAKLRDLADDLESLDDLHHIYMEALTSLDFSELCAEAKVKWVGGDPVFYDECGLAIFPVSEAGLAFMMSKSPELVLQQQADLAAVQAFLDEHGTAHIYEVATF